jgi:hypothetical protein
MHFHVRQIVARASAEIHGTDGKSARGIVRLDPIQAAFGLNIPYIRVIIMAVESFLILYGVI